MQFLSDIEFVTSFLYPAMVAACLAVSALLSLTYWTWDRAPVILVMSVYFLLQTAVFAILFLSAHQKPVPEPAEGLTLLRILMLINLGAVIFWQIRRFSERDL